MCGYHNYSFRPVVLEACMKKLKLGWGVDVAALGACGECKLQALFALRFFGEASMTKHGNLRLPECERGAAQQRSYRPI